ncbi:DUF4326 domain-containing protein [Jannaschia formosa]|uniref:DUF4326 domain-containing protein n=1 Tax=Jannaschia formosa TaxID=2259592 RepID=UPI000E1BBA13|nr:DUF4326 domain-containing protein [Jannaschia formosa]TFL15934.1 DUF4326 domain-containing protein [Jannaschia formosa]
MPKVHNSRAGTAPRHAVYVGRGSPWGNPFRIGPDGTRNDVCDRFEREVLPELDLAPLRGRDLVCFCAPARCHADALLAAANADPRRARSAGSGKGVEIAKAAASAARPVASLEDEPEDRQGAFDLVSHA